jgi:predicted permease
LSFTDALNLFQASLAISLPTFGWVLCGQVLHRLGVFPLGLNEKIARLAFTFGLPVMLFAGAAQVDYRALGGAYYLLAGVLATLVIFAVSWQYSKWRGHPRAEQGLFVQAAFRSNLAIIGIALTYSAYGERGPVLAALPVALMTVLYNVLAVWVLNATLGAGTTMRATVVGVARNPLIIGISAGVVFSLLGSPSPQVMGPMSAGLSAFFLPVVLICIGGAMNLSRLYRAGGMAWEASVWRLVIAPALGVGIALLLGVRDEHLGVLFLLIATPVAASGHVMVVAARGDGALAANITVLTTALSLVSITLGFFLLSMFSLVGEMR